MRVFLDTNITYIADKQMKKQGVVRPRRTMCFKEYTGDPARHTRNSATG